MTSLLDDHPKAVLLLQSLTPCLYAMALNIPYLHTLSQQFFHQPCKVDRYYFLHIKNQGGPAVGMAGCLIPAMKFMAEVRPQPGSRSPPPPILYQLPSSILIKYILISLETGASLEKECNLGT